MDIQERCRLLELAAKAAGIEIEWNIMINFHSTILTPKTLKERNWLGHEHTLWDPLTDDGDALRLAVYLFRDIHFWYFDNSVSVGNEQRVVYGDDPCAATRLAIVRAAAEVGRGMP